MKATSLTYLHLNLKFSDSLLDSAAHHQSFSTVSQLRVCQYWASISKLGAFLVLAQELCRWFHHLKWWILLPQLVARCISMRKRSDRKIFVVSFFEFSRGFGHQIAVAHCKGDSFVRRALFRIVDVLTVCFLGVLVGRISFAIFVQKLTNHFGV